MVYTTIAATLPPLGCKGTPFMEMIKTWYTGIQMITMNNFPEYDCTNVKILGWLGCTHDLWTMQHYNDAASAFRVPGLCNSLTSRRWCVKSIWLDLDLKVVCIHIYIGYIRYH